MISLVGVLIGYIVLGIFGYAQGLHWIMYAGSIAFSIFNGLYYIISEPQRISIIKNRVYTVYLGACILLFFAAFDSVILIIRGLDFMGYGYGSYVLYLIFSIAFICLVILQAGSFALMVKQAAETIPGLMGN